MLKDEAWIRDWLHGRECTFAQIASGLNEVPLN